MPLKMVADWQRERERNTHWLGKGINSSLWMMASLICLTFSWQALLVRDLVHSSIWLFLLCSILEQHILKTNAASAFTELFQRFMMTQLEMNPIRFISESQKNQTKFVKVMFWTRLILIINLICRHIGGTTYTKRTHAIAVWGLSLLFGPCDGQYMSGRKPEDHRRRIENDIF